MPTVYKVLGQSAPPSTANSDVYTVPSATSAVISTITVTNVTGNTVNFRIFIRPAGAAAGVGNALVYDASIFGNDVRAFTIGVTLATTDVVTVQTGTGTALTFQVFGSEIS